MYTREWISKQQAKVRRYGIPIDNSMFIEPGRLARFNREMQSIVAGNAERDKAYAAVRATRWIPPADLRDPTDLQGLPRVLTDKYTGKPTTVWNRCCDAINDILDDKPDIDEWVSWALDPAPAAQFKAFTTLHHSLTKENTMNCENKAPIRHIIDQLNYQIDRAQRDATPAPVFDAEKYNVDLRKAYAAHIVNENTNLSDMDEVLDKFDQIETRVRNKHTKTTKVDTFKYDALRKELAAVTNIAMIQGEDSVRTNLLAIAEKIAKL